MYSVLAFAHTWFFDSVAHQIDGTLIVRLLEGLKSPFHQDVVVEDTRLGMGFAVAVQENNRVLEVIFTNTLAFFM